MIMSPDRGPHSSSLSRACCSCRRSLGPRPSRRPTGYVPPGKHEPEPPPPSPLKWRIAADARAGGRRCAAPAGLPTVGWGAGVQVTRALVDVGRIRLGVGADFGYERISDQPTAPVPDFSHHLAHMTFAALSRARRHLRSVAAVDRRRRRAERRLVLPAAIPIRGSRRRDVRTVVPLVQLELGLSRRGLPQRRSRPRRAPRPDVLVAERRCAAFTVFSGGVFSPRLAIGFRF